LRPPARANHGLQSERRRLRAEHGSHAIENTGDVDLVFLGCGVELSAPVAEGHIENDTELNFRCIRGREPAGRGRNDVGEAVSGDKSEVGTHSQKRGPDEALPHAAHDSLLITLSIATQLLLNLTTCVRGPINYLLCSRFCSIFGCLAVPFTAMETTVPEPLRRKNGISGFNRKDFHPVTA
jgi:hypothetical protein